jgi:hypothetical protein
MNRPLVAAMPLTSTETKGNLAKETAVLPNYLLPSIDLAVIRIVKQSNYMPNSAFAPGSLAT